MRVFIVIIIVIMLTIFFPIVPAIIKVPVTTCETLPCQAENHVIWVKLTDVFNFHDPLAGWKNYIK